MENKEHTPYDLMKRFLDILVSVAALVISTPMLIIAYLLIKMDGGPVLFRQQRVGKNGKTFTMFKLRTMVPDAYKMECEMRKASDGYGLCKRFNDPRITPVGMMLRRTNLDELPQFFNILRGEMSLIGPRPVPYEESLFYGDKRDEVLSVRPGLTGYWQVKRRMSMDYAERIKLDCHYVKHRSPLMDAFILLSTPISMLTSDYNSVTKPLPPSKSNLLSNERKPVFTQSSAHPKKEESISDLRLTG